MKLAKAMATVAGLTGLSRIAGFIRDILTAAILGAGPLADAFFVALKLPNFFRRVTAEGAFSVAFVPLYSEKLEKEDRARADLFASNAFMVMLSFLTVLTLLALAAMPYIIDVIAPGFESGSERYEAAIELSRITFPYLLFMSLTALLGGVLNALDRFAPFAFAPVLFNLCLIAALLLNGFFESAGHALSYGILAAGVLQLLWLYTSARRQGFHLKIAVPRIDADMKRLFKLMGPGIIGAGVVHINLFADMIIASFLQEGSISFLYYADRLNQLPLGVVGIAVGTALLPMLSKALAADNLEEGRNLFNRALEFCLLLALPAALALGVIAHELVTVLFQRGAFDAHDTQMTSMVLICYAIGLPAYIATKVFATAHWARHDTKTPVKISIFATLINIALCLVFIQFIGVAGIALGTGLTGWLQFAAYVRSLRAHPAARFDERFRRAAPRIILSSCIMAATLFVVARLLQGMIYEPGIPKYIALAALVASGLIAYAASTHISGAFKLTDLKRYLVKRTKT
ncbi:MAG: murein biosynthesis integral membrane protein MurJ [Alphaproteobacteria bacterium]|nr:murein biosynthesis integral membrane protein MurJ [Alphaproteobacteria bacterium]